MCNSLSMTRCRVVIIIEIQYAVNKPMIIFSLCLSQGHPEKGLEMKKLVLSGFLASEEIYINQLDALLLVCIGTHFANTHAFL